MALGRWEPLLVVLTLVSSSSVDSSSFESSLCVGPPLLSLCVGIWAHYCQTLVEKTKSLLLGGSLLFLHGLHGFLFYYGLDDDLFHFLDEYPNF